jgi:hypothetical protein
MLEQVPFTNKGAATVTSFVALHVAVEPPFNPSHFQLQPVFVAVKLVDVPEVHLPVAGGSVEVVFPFILEQVPFTAKGKATVVIILVALHAAVEPPFNPSHFQLQPVLVVIKLVGVPVVHLEVAVGSALINFPFVLEQAPFTAVAVGPVVLVVPAVLVVSIVVVLVTPIAVAPESCASTCCRKNNETANAQTANIPIKKTRCKI